MNQKRIEFSRLLKVFSYNKEPAYIVEVSCDNRKILYLSYYSKIRRFIPYQQTPKKDRILFDKLSNFCLLSTCDSTQYMLFDSNITHFEADCPNVVSSDYMFSMSKIIEVKSSFPKAKSAKFMFYKSSVEKVDLKFPILENGNFMFFNSKLKHINCRFPKMKQANKMFNTNSSKLKQQYPHYFI